MIESVLYSYLKGRLSVPVTLERSEKPPEKYVIIEKTGSSFDNHIYSATFAIQSIAKYLYDAAEINEAVKQAMLYGAMELPEIGSVDLNSDYNFTDPESKEYRYQAVFDITHY